MSALNSIDDAKRSYDERHKKEYLEHVVSENILADKKRKECLVAQLRILDEKPIETIMDFAKNEIEENKDTQHKLLKHIEKTGAISDIDIFHSRCDTQYGLFQYVKKTLLESEFMENPCQKDDYELFLEAIKQYWFNPSIPITKGPFEGYLLTFEVYSHFGYIPQVRMRLHKDFNLWKAFWQWSFF